ncbi:hypothetical protein KDU71_21270 [Carboxylicivirga sediminis]|uniref:Uncharacterized protein n=1 Tax=Carboxylicivirga sediminis TaxID=2006564 RepID=A0A941FCD3_9BACT|nr:hypothetical protein [Carboxylicivirga sediminis]MBR8538115.1 hypothetical protein [Carboxylicivirga sediminis]
MLLQPCANHYKAAKHRCSHAQAITSLQNAAAAMRKPLQSCKTMLHPCAGYYKFAKRCCSHAQAITKLQNTAVAMRKYL